MGVLASIYSTVILRRHRLGPPIDIYRNQCRRPQSKGLYPCPFVFLLFRFGRFIRSRWFLSLARLPVLVARCGL